MNNINLRTDAGLDSGKIKLGKGLPLAIFILAIVGLAYAAIMFYTKKVEGEIKTSQVTYDQKLEALKNGNAKNVFDFQNRLSESKKMIASSSNPNDDLYDIEKHMIPGVYLNTYGLDAGKNILSLDCVASNYNDVAKQIFSFKKSAYFSSVSAGETSLSGTDGKIHFIVDLKIK